MHEQLHHEINHLLEHIYASQENIDTEEQTSKQPRRRLNVYIELEEEVELPEVIESTPEQEQTDSATCNDMHTPLFTQQQSGSLPESQAKNPRIPRTRRIPLLLTLFACMGMSLGIAYDILSPMLTPSATVNIVTTASHKTTTSIIHVVRGVADPVKHQVAGRVLSAVTTSQAKTIPTTGTAHQDARAAHGFLTFYNAAPYIQTVHAGTLLTSVDGVQIVTDQDAIISAAIMPTEGQVTVAAHAALVGPTGNIRADDVYGQCCRLNVFVANGPFYGGQDARTYPTVTQQDMNGGEVSLKTSLDEHALTMLQTQVQGIETLITPLLCTRKIQSDHAVGEEASHITLMGNETCTGTVYRSQAFTLLTNQIATEEAVSRLGRGYTTTGVQTTITQASSKDLGDSDVQVKIVSSWVYPFDQKQQAIKMMIAGKSKGKAIAILRQITGVQMVTIGIAGNDSSVLPINPKVIHILIVQEGQ